MPEQCWQISGSRQLRRFIGVIHALALLGCVLNGLPALAQLFAALLVVLSWVHQLTCTTTRWQLKYSHDSGWRLSSANQQEQGITILGSTLTTSWLLVIHGKMANGRRWQQVVFRDALSAEDYRRLIVALKICPNPLN